MKFDEALCILLHNRRPEAKKKKTLFLSKSFLIVHWWPALISVQCFSPGLHPAVFSLEVIFALVCPRKDYLPHVYFIHFS